MEKDILAAVKILVEDNPNAYVGFGAIVSKTLEQIKKSPKYSMHKKGKENLIKNTIRRMKRNGKIRYVFRNKYYLPAGKIPPQAPLKPDRTLFQVPPQKQIPEKSTVLDPNKKGRNSSDFSKSSISGDEFESKRKEFYGTKRIIKQNFNPILPGVRKVKQIKQKFANRPGYMRTTKSELVFSLNQVPGLSYRLKTRSLRFRKQFSVYDDKFEESSEEDDMNKN